MNMEKFKLETSSILNFTETGIQCKETHHDLDIIIYATGFELKSNYYWLTKENVLSNNFHFFFK